MSDREAEIRALLERSEHGADVYPGRPQELYLAARDLLAELTALREREAAKDKALRIIAEHEHPDSCDGICADTLRDYARDALAASPTEEQT